MALIHHRQMRIINTIERPTLSAIQTTFHRIACRPQYYLMIVATSAPNADHVIAIVTSHNTVLCSENYHHHYYYDPNFGKVLETQRPDSLGKYFASPYFLRYYPFVRSLHEVIPVRQSLGL